MASLAMNQSSQMKNALEVIREEGLSGETSEAHKIGFKYAMSVMGTFEDYKNGFIIIRRKWRGGEEVTFSEMLHSVPHASGIGYSEDEAKKIFFRRSEREYEKANGRKPSCEYLEEKWETFKLGSGGRLVMPKFAGGPVTYHQLRGEGKTEEEIELLFNQLRRKYPPPIGGLGYATYEEFQKLLANWNYIKYCGGEASNGFSSQLERFSKRPMGERTSFCMLIGRMMLLVQAKHRQNLSNSRSHQRTRQAEQKKIANDKRCTKYNMVKGKMGTTAFNAMKARDQTAKEKKKGCEVGQNISKVSRFTQWRTQTAAGRAFDKAPVAGYVRMFHTPPRFGRCKQKVQLGYGTRATLANVVKDCVRRRRAKGLSDMYISFKPDPTRAETQVYQYAALQGRGAVQLGKTKDVDCSRTFKITGVFVVSPYDCSKMWVNLDSIQGSVYYSLPAEWNDFEEWSGFGIKGNPKCSTMMKTLFKITDSNIESFRFMKDDKEYSVGYTTNVHMQKSAAELLGGVKSKYDTAAAAAALLAEEEKRRRAQAARAAESAKAARKQNGMPYFPTNDKTKKSLKAMLAQQLAEGKIDMEAFKMGMSALD